jgi:hypothetical protein
VARHECINVSGSGERDEKASPGSRQTAAYGNEGSAASVMTPARSATNRRGSSIDR